VLRLSEGADVNMLGAALCTPLACTCSEKLLQLSVATFRDRSWVNQQSAPGDERERSASFLILVNVGYRGMRRCLGRLLRKFPCLA
jgi:hypothetical protein